MNKEVVENEQIEALQHALAERTAQLEAVTHELEKFSYSVSHDLRAPLRAIEGFSKILLEDYTDKLDEEGQRFLKILDASSRKMTRLLDDLLSFSRLSRQEIKLSKVPMRELVESVWDEIKDKYSAREIDLKISPLPDCRGDGSLLRHVWANLLGNAIKFTRSMSRAQIEINAREEAGRIVYCIKDNGVGFDIKLAKKLFGVFQRLHTEEEFEGNGVGLAIAQRLLRRQSGEIWADAKPNEGAAFYFTLPCVENIN